MHINKIYNETRKNVLESNKKKVLFSKNEKKKLKNLIFI